MAFIQKINSKARTSIDTGFGVNAASYGGRFVNKNGGANIKKTGLGFLEQYSWFHSMLAMSKTKFFIIILLFYILVNIAFTVVYYLVGVEHLSGLEETHSAIEKFIETFFFSSQTFTTVGYGRISPVGFATSAVAAFQALIGLLSFAVATGLMYGRFSRPKAYLKFSHNAIIAPYKDIKALMFRLAPFKNTTLTDAEAKVTLALICEENGKAVNKFYPLELEFPKINNLNLSWTIVHPITEDSPLHGFTDADYKNTKGELIVFVKAFDDMFSNTVVARSSYLFDEMVYGAKFLPMYHRNEINNSTVLELSKLNEFTKENLE